MKKRGISGIVLCFFCCVEFFLPVFVFADSIVSGDESHNQEEITQLEVVDSQEENNISDESENLDQVGDEQTNSLEENSTDDSENPENIGENQTEDSSDEQISDDNTENMLENSDIHQSETGETVEDENTDGGDSNSETESNELIFPEIFIYFQNPSYILEKEIQKDEYICDDEKDECKVNIKILDENQQDISSDFGCEINFSNGEIFQDCNPTTVIFEAENNNILIKIFEKNNINNFIEKNIFIIKNNIGEDNSSENSGEEENPADDGNNNEENPDETGNNPDESGENQTGTGETVEGENSDGGENNSQTDGNEIIFPEIFIDFQNPSYILEKEIQKEEYICDEEQEECKVNIKILNKNQQEISSDFGCEVTFSNGEIFQDCNPTTVIFEVENNEISIKIYEKNNINNFIEKEIIILKNNIGEDDSSENTEEELSGDDEENPDDDGSNNEEIPDENGNNSEDGNDTQTGTGETLEDENSDGGDNNSQPDGNEIIFPEIFIDFQNPSYILEKEIQKVEYICDEEQEECKVNIKILDENQQDISSDFGCEITFSNGEIFQDCNPTTVIFEAENNEISIKIYEKNNINSFIEKEIIILKNNIGEDNLSENTEEEVSGDNEENPDETVENVEDNDSDEMENTQNDSSPEIALPNIILDIQSGAERNGENIVCDKNQCSINFTLENSFEGFDESDFECEWYFGGGTFSTENTDKKCNPGYVKYDIGNFDMQIKIFQKNNPENFISQTFFIKNSVKENHSSKSAGGNSSQKSVEKIEENVTVNKEIIVQSGLENNICNQEKCSVNLQYDNASYETCVWNFLDLENREKYTRTCNPRNIYVPAGNYNITLEVTNSKTNTRHNKNLFIMNQYQKPDESENNYEFSLELQGKKVDYKKKIGNKIVCLGVEKCSVNLNINKYKNLEYKWTFPNNHIVEKSNPSSVWFEQSSQSVFIEISHNQEIIFSQEYRVEVIPPEKKQEIFEIAEQIELADKHENNFLQSLENIDFRPEKINGIKQESLENIGKYISKSQKNIMNHIKKINYFEEKDTDLKLKLTRNISKQKKALKYSGKTFPNATIFIDNGNEILEIQSDENGKYENKKIQDIQSGNFILDYYVIDQQGNYFHTSNYKNLDISTQYVTQLQENIQKNNDKKVSKTSKKSSKTRVDTPKNLDEEIQYATVFPPVEISREMTLYQKILWGVIIGIFFLALFIITRKYKIL